MWGYVLFGLVIVVLLGAMYVFGAQPTGRSDPGILRRRSRWRRWLPVVPLLGAVGCLALAFSGFQFSLQQESPVVVLVMDISDSMNATDISPNRLTAAKDAAQAFLAEVPDDFLVGLVTFAGEADEAVPPTLERDVVIATLASVQTSNGTVIGDGLDAGLDTIASERPDPETPAAMVLLSDGKDTNSNVPPLVAATRAAEANIPVDTVFLGQEAGLDAADPETLRAIAETSGGGSFTAKTAEQLTQRFTTIGSRLSVALEAEQSATPLVIAALGLVIVAAFLLILTPR